MINPDCVNKCVRLALGFYICEGDKVIIKAGREIFSGEISGVSPIAIMLDNELLIKISKITWVKWIERGCKT